MKNLLTFVLVALCGFAAAESSPQDESVSLEKSELVRLLASAYVEAYDDPIMMKSVGASSNRVTVFLYSDSASFVPAKAAVLEDTIRCDLEKIFSQPTWPSNFEIKVRVVPLDGGS